MLLIEDRQELLNDARENGAVAVGIIFDREEWERYFVQIMPGDSPHEVISEEMKRLEIEDGPYVSREILGV